MKVKANYYYEMDNKIGIRLSLTDIDYFSSRIAFYIKQEWAAKDGKCLLLDQDCTLYYTLNNADEARLWVANQVASIRQKVSEWRKHEVPLDEEFDI